jgi:hypothetical protein
MVSTRNSAELREVVGPMLTTQILRTDLSVCRTFAELLACVHRAIVEGLANRDAAIDRAVAGVPEAWRPAVLSVSTLVVFQQMSQETWTMGDLECSAFPAAPGASDELEITSYELICEVEARPGSLHVAFRYDADLFEDELAGELIDEFLAVLASARGDAELGARSAWKAVR